MKKGLCDILFGVHHVDVVWKFEVLKIGKLREGGNVSPVVRLTISFKIFFPFTFAFAFAFPFTGRLKSFQLSKHIRTRKRWNLVYFMDNFAFCEVLLVFPIRMVWREELSMQVKGNILATLL